MWGLLFVAGIAVNLYLYFLFNNAGKLALIPYGFSITYGYFLSGLLWNFLKKPVNKKTRSYIRRETHYDGGNRREIEITLHTDG